MDLDLAKAEAEAVAKVRTALPPALGVPVVLGARTIHREMLVLGQPVGARQQGDDAVRVGSRELAGMHGLPVGIAEAAAGVIVAETRRQDQRIAGGVRLKLAQDDEGFGVETVMPAVASQVVRALTAAVGAEKLEQVDRDRATVGVRIGDAPMTSKKDLLRPDERAVGAFRKRAEVTSQRVDVREVNAGEEGRQAVGLDGENRRFPPFRVVTHLLFPLLLVRISFHVTMSVGD